MTGGVATGRSLQVEGMIERQLLARSPNSGYPSQGVLLSAGDLFELTHFMDLI